MAESLLVLALYLFHLEPHLPLVDYLLELMRFYLAKHVPMLVDIIAFCFLHFSHSLIDDLGIDLSKWVKLDDVRLQLFNRLRGYHNLASALADLDKLEDFAFLEIFLAAESAHSLLLLVETLVVFHPLVELRVLVVADVHKLLLLLEKHFLLGKLLVVLDHVVGSLLDIVQGNGQTDDLKLLLLNPGVVENTLLVQTEQLLLKLRLDLDDLLADSTKVDEPLLLLLLCGVFDTLFKLFKLLPFLFVHVIHRFVHPLLAD